MTRSAALSAVLFVTSIAAAQGPPGGPPRNGIRVPLIAPADGPATPYIGPKADGPVVELLEDAPDPLVPLLTNPVGGEPGEARREDRDAFAGLHALRVTLRQKYQSHLPSWDLKIVEKPTKAGEFRHVRFAWKKLGGTGIMVQLHDAQRTWIARYVAGPNTVGWEAVSVAAAAPPEWEVVTRDLFKDFGAMTVTGVAFTPMDGEGGLFDHVLLGRTVEDLDRHTDAALGRAKPAAALTDAERAAHWHHLTDRSGEKAAAALRAFLATAPESVGFVRRQLAKPADDPAGRVAALIADLDADAFAVREAASAELRRIGTPAVVLLQEAARGAESAEVRFRAAELLKALAPKPGEDPPAALRAARVVRVLERAATPEARALLEEMARREFGAGYVADAEAVLRRLR